jgi:hypothetical protein
VGSHCRAGGICSRLLCHYRIRGLHCRLVGIVGVGCDGKSSDTCTRSGVGRLCSGCSDQNRPAEGEDGRTGATAPPNPRRTPYSLSEVGALARRRWISPTAARVHPNPASTPEKAAGAITHTSASAERPSSAPKMMPRPPRTAASDPMPVFMCQFITCSISACVRPVHQTNLHGGRVSRPAASALFDEPACSTAARS